MKKINLLIIIICLVLFTLLGAAAISDQKPHRPEKPYQLPENTPAESSEATAPEPESEFGLPVAEFEERITKKPFGIFITPENSPVQPERFAGYHTGVDVEYENVAGKVPVFAACDGEIVLNRWVAGYGGTLGLECSLESETIYILYGHLDPSSFIKNTRVKKGAEIAVLGEGQTQATDFERKHLHLSVSKDKLDLRGYVDNQDELSQWHDPESFLLSRN